MIQHQGGDKNSMISVVHIPFHIHLIQIVQMNMDSVSNQYGTEYGTPGTVLVEEVSSPLLEEDTVIVQQQPKLHHRVYLLSLENRLRSFETT